MILFNKRIVALTIPMLVILVFTTAKLTNAWLPAVSTNKKVQRIFPFSVEKNDFQYNNRNRYSPITTTLFMSSETEEKTKTKKEVEPDIPYDYTVPEDAIIHIRPMAMKRLRELREQQITKGKKKDDDTDSSNNEYLYLRMGVRSGGCSGMSYVMDFITNPETEINMEDDMIDMYEEDKIQCVVDSKSMLYLYGLRLDYSDQLIGGGFKFYNPNAEESCGCGSSFGV